MTDLREFIEKTKELGELKVIEGANWDQEIGAITTLAARSASRPALLFDQIRGYNAGYRLFTVPDSTEKRIALVFGLAPELSRLEIVRSLRDKLNEPLELVPPEEVKDGPIMENVHVGEEVDLFEFPAPRWMPRDGGRYIGTGDNVITRDPDEGWVNVGTYRVEIHDKATATVYFDPGKHADMIRRKYWSKGQGCPTVVTCGQDPLLVQIGAMRLPWGMPEYSYAGWWRKEPVKVIRGPTTGLPIPADAEIALEGEMVPPDVDTRLEGPFAEWTGHYSPAKPEAAFKVKCILHRDDPIILGVLPFLGFGVPYSYRRLWAARVWSVLDKLIPGVTGVFMLDELEHTALVISLRQQYGGHAKQAALAAIGCQSYDVKYVVVVDEDIDPSNVREVLWALALRGNPEEFDTVRGTWCCALNPLLSPQKREVGDITSSAAIITACRPYHWIKDFPPLVLIPPEVRENVEAKWGGAWLD